MSQGILRILTVAPVPSERAPSLIESCGVMVIGRARIANRALTPDERTEIQREVYILAQRRPSMPYKRIKAKDQPAVMRARLLAFAARHGDTSLIVAGRLLRDHGDDARGVLVRTWRPDWPVTLSAVDELLHRAGVLMGGAP